MSDEDTVFGECRRCGADATLAVCHPDGVFREVCRECFNESLEPGAFTVIKRRLADWRALLSGGLVVLLSGVAMQFTPVEQVVSIPSIFYIVLGLVGIGLGLKRFRSRLTNKEEA